MNCLSCPKLNYKRCGRLECVKTSSSIQYVKNKDYRCTEGQQNLCERKVDKYIYENSNHEYVVKDNDVFLGKYRKLINAVSKRDEYIKKYKTTEYNR